MVLSSVFNNPYIPFLRLNILTFYKFLLSEMFLRLKQLLSNDFFAIFIWKIKVSKWDVI